MDSWTDEILIIEYVFLVLLSSQVIFFIASRIHKNAPLRLTSITESHSSDVSSCTLFEAPPTPALLTSTSILPNTLIVCSIKEMQMFSCDISPTEDVTHSSVAPMVFFR